MKISTLLLSSLALAVDLQLFANAPSSELTSVMMGRESTFGTAATPTVTEVCDDADWTGTNETLERPGATKAVGQNDEPTGLFLGKWTASVEPDPDTIGSFLAMAFGAESVGANANNNTLSTVSTTITASTAVGATVFNFTSVTGIANGNGFRIDAGLPTQEDFTVSNVSGNNITVSGSGARYAHASGAAITANVLGYDHTFSFSSPRPSFTAQLNRVLNTINAMGCKVAQVDFSCAEKQIMQMKLSGPYVNEAAVGSPTSPSYTVINPTIFQATPNFVQINGSTVDASVMSWQISYQTGVETTYPRFGNGRIQFAFPEKKSVVTLKLDMAYETMTQFYNYWGGQGVLGPQPTVPSLPNCSILCASPDFVNYPVNYKMQFNFGKVKVISCPTPAKAKDYLKNTVTCKVYMSTRGANDDLKVVLTNASNANSI